MRAAIIGLLSVLFISIGWAGKVPGFHISGNVPVYLGGGYLFGLAIGYSGGGNVSLRLKGNYLPIKDGATFSIKGGVRKYIGTDKPSGAFVEGGFGYWNLGSRFGNLEGNIGAFSLYGNLGYRFGQRFFLEGSVGLDSFFILLAWPFAEIAVGVSF